MRRSFHFRFIDALLWWFLFALVAISFVASHAFLALAIAIIGGIVLGAACVLGSKPLQR